MKSGRPFLDGRSLCKPFQGDYIMAFNLKTRIWQTGALDWWAMLDNEDVYLGTREFPLPPEEGDEWHVKKTGDLFKVIDGEICRLGNKPYLGEEWLKDSLK
jgi:hypothetical protein